MKKKWPILPFLALAIVLVLTLLPVSFLSADTNLAQNSSFSDSLNDWDIDGNVVPISETAYATGADGVWTGVYQYIETSKKDLTLSFDYNAVSFIDYGELNCGFALFNGPGPPIGEVELEGTDTLDTWFHFNEKISELYGAFNGGAHLPDFDWIEIWVGVKDTAKAYFDNVKLVVQEKAAEKEEVVWVRTQEMTCNHVWVNEDNKFQFSFIYPYRDNNWVKIYDTSGKEVFSVDMPYDNPNLIVDLPNGMYTVKTFTVGSTEPIQTFLIGKP